MDQNKEITSYLTYRLSILYQELTLHGSYITKNHGNIGITEWRLLVIIIEEKAETLKDLVALSGFDPALISRNLHKMIDKDLISTKVDKNDRRRSEITVLSAGKELYDSLFPIMLERQRKLLSCLEEDEQESVFKIVNKLIKHMDRIKDNGYKDL